MWTWLKRLVVVAREQAARVRMVPDDPVVAEWLRWEAQRRRELRVERQRVLDAVLLESCRRRSPGCFRPGGVVL